MLTSPQAPSKVRKPGSAQVSVFKTNLPPPLAKEQHGSNWNMEYERPRVSPVDTLAKPNSEFADHETFPKSQLATKWNTVVRFAATSNVGEGSVGLRRWRSVDTSRQPKTASTKVNPPIA